MSTETAITSPNMHDDSVHDAIFRDPSGTNGAEASVTDGIRGTLDALSVRRVFGEPYVADGVTIIPVARVTGGAGGGGGSGSGPGNVGGHGFGSSFGLGAHPVGVYEVSHGNVKFRPTIDVNRLIRGSQILAGVTLCALFLLRTRHRMAALRFGDRAHAS
jgi:uncharacterized spore protein YtfJ